MECLRVWPGAYVVIAWILIVKYVGMRIVLMFCSHRINLG